MSKIIAYTALHYGTDYLGWAIRSVIDYVEEYHVLYSAIGSHGHRTEAVCPDTRKQLYAIAQKAAGDKLHWHDGEWAHEGLQRESIHEYAPDADMIFVLDADEIWPHDTVMEIADIPSRYGWYQIRLPMIHYWRSFHQAILHDPAYPIRVIFPKNKVHGTTITYTESSKIRESGIYVEPVPPINHMGYAQRSAIVEYKQHTHGHKGEWRKDVDWYQDRFLANAQRDCHPVGSEWWNPETINPLDYMPPFMALHPYFDKDVID